MTSISRRQVFQITAGASLVALVGCGTLTASQIVTIAQQDITDAESIIKAILAELGAALPANINVLVSDATSALNALAPGQVVAPTSVSGILTDLGEALQAAQSVLPGNPVLLDAGIVLSALQAAWSVVNTLAAPDPISLAAARARLAALKA